MAKSLFLTAYDYGMGAIWSVISAHSADEIKKKYPEFDVFTARPVWMENSEYLSILDDSFYDIDEPNGWLAEFFSSERKL